MPCFFYPRYSLGIESVDSLRLHKRKGKPRYGNRKLGLLYVLLLLLIGLGYSIYLCYNLEPRPKMCNVIRNLYITSSTADSKVAGQSNCMLININLEIPHLWLVWNKKLRKSEYIVIEILGMCIVRIIHCWQHIITLFNHIVLFCPDSVLADLQYSTCVSVS